MSGGAGLPAGLARLSELARDLWWSWHPDAEALFRALAPGGRAPRDSDPITWLSALPPETLEAHAQDGRFLERYRAVLQEFDRARAGEGTWFRGRDPGLGGPVAYFSAEFGVHGTLPIYAGGLGILAGDIAKEASDLGLPLVGVGFMYPQGYFHQHVAPDGRQEELYEVLDRSRAPVEPACVEPGRQCVVPLDLPDRRLHVAVWLVRLGRSRLYLMDTDLDANAPWDRELSARLYGGDQDLRLRQEVVLGTAGVRLLRALGVAPAVWHANEGHSALMMVERVRELVAARRPFTEALEAVRASTVFTTHTPVPAGHDVFPFPLVERYLGAYWPALGLDRERFLALGAHREPWGTGFNMTALALRLSAHRNAVSRRHGEVARRMWQGLWPDRPEAEVPIISITNGVHVPSWLAPELRELYAEHLPGWLEAHDDPAAWSRIAQVPDEALWSVHLRLKRRLLVFLRERARRRWADERAAPAQVTASGALLDPDVLTLGFARRFATYKRATLVLRDPARLRRLLTDPGRPVQLVFAGKAHPADEPGKAVLRTVYQAALDPAFEGRITFVEDYDAHVARRLVQGVDVWLNTPRPPLEASGTSGMKAALHGVLNVSVLDGWWAEAWDGENGWAIGAPWRDGEPDETRDAADAEALYQLLETELPTLSYDHDPGGVPRRWVARMKRAVQTIAPRFSARRMVKDYVERLYLPASGSRREDAR